MIKYLTEDSWWMKFYPKFNSSFFVEKAGYFDERPQVHTSMTQLLALFSIPFLCIFSFWFLALLPLVFFGYGKLYINLPIKTGIQDCESGAWGFNYHDNKIWIYIGGAGNFDGGRKWKTISMPWEYEWARTSTLLNDNTWYNETKSNRGQKYSSEGSYKWIEENKWKETHPYKDPFDGKIVNATIGVSEREWRMKCLKWTKLFAKIRRDIDVDFDQEVGKKKGSWKGGVIGCGYDLKAKETPYECLKRMEKERSF